MSDILHQISDGLLTLTFNRVAKKNSITADMYASLADHLNAAAADPAIRVALIQGHPDAFSAGNDLADFLKTPPTDEQAPVWRFLYAMSSFPKPLIAAVSGSAVGIGTTLLLHCDLVYASTTAKFSLPFVNLGLCPEAASSLLLPQLIGHQRAAQLFLFGDSFSVEDAKDFGLVNHITAPDDVNAYALRQAQRLLEKPTVSLLEIKRLMKANAAAVVKKHIQTEGTAFIQLLGGPAVREAVAAFSEKRKPNFHAAKS